MMNIIDKADIHKSMNEISGQRYDIERMHNMEISKADKRK